MEPPLVRVTVVFCAADVEDITEVSVPAGSTLRDAIEAARIYVRRPELSKTTDVGIWGQRCSLDRVLADGDRVELYRPLTIDPMEARRLRADLRRKRRVRT